MDNIFEWTFNEQLRLKYEESLDNNTIIKVQNYKKKQVETKLINIKKRMSDLPNNITNINIMATVQSEQKMINEEINNLMTEEEITNLSNEYCDYRDKADMFLRKYNYFKIDNRQMLTTECILSYTMYANYITKLFKNIHWLGHQIISNNMDNLYYSKVEQIHVKNKNITRFTLLVTQLYNMLYSISDTDNILRQIIKTHIVETANVENYNKLQNKINKYIINKQLNRPMLSTTWYEYFKYKCTTSVNSQGNYIYSINQYLEYCALIYSANKLQNELVTVQNQMIIDSDIVDWLDYMFYFKQTTEKI
ncbi:hypothetical protein N8459_03560 [Nitrosopumilus sp.]|nr:hypothetical protein [Nitrosopumilus sp.]